ncbi:unnamed protein product, partial [Laminaria digitata]
SELSGGGAQGHLEFGAYLREQIRLQPGGGARGRAKGSGFGRSNRGDGGNFPADSVTGRRWQRRWRRRE